MVEETLHIVHTELTYVKVILPLAVPNLYTYYIPPEWIGEVQVGMRVEVQLGKSKLYAALVSEIHEEAPKDYKAKPIISLIDEKPIVQPFQIQFWKWIAQYYCCTPGEVMMAALPAGLRL
ncbi:MAG: primosomal protein N', partial [Bacteroidota bacterium]